jgi:DNA polymerase III alpha subunit
VKGKGVPVLPYGINADAVAFSFEDGVIRAPLLAIISLDKAEWDAIVEERIYRGDFASFEEFLARMKGRLSMDAAMELVGAGVFDDGGASRDSLRYICDSFYHGSAEAAPPYAHPQRPTRSGKTKTGANQISLFGPERDEGPSEPSKG